jgi:hypothetical protein
MTSRNIDNHPQPLEKRVSALEAELAQMKQLLAGLGQSETPRETSWWLSIAGSFADDPTFDEVTKLGQIWRQSAD